MSEPKYEDGTITVKDATGEIGEAAGKYKKKTLIFTRNYSGPATIEFYKNNTTLVKTEKATIKDGKLNGTISYPLTKVDDAAASYEIKVKLKYKTTEKLLATVPVWPKQAKVTFVDENGNAMPHFNFMVEQNGATRDLSTDDQGKATFDLLKAPYTVEPKDKYLVISRTPVTPGKLRDDKIQVKSAITAKFIKPDISDAAYLDDPNAVPAKKQWVNLESAITTAAAGQGCDAKGSTVSFTVTANDDAERRAGAKVYFEVTLGRESKRDNPLPKVTAAYPISDLQVAGNKTTGYVQLDASNSPTGYFQVELGIAGGDTCEVKIGGTSAVSDATLKLINWRKLTYQMRFPNLMQSRLTQRTRQDGTSYYDLPDSIRNVFVQRLGLVFVEYENRVSIPYADPAAGSPSRVKKGFMDLNADATELYVLDGNVNWGKSAAAFDAHNLREITITLCDRAYSSRVKTLAYAKALTAVSTEENIDAAAQYIYFVKRPDKVNTVNLEVTGYEWEADLSGVSAVDKDKKPSFTCSTEDGNAGGPLSVLVSELTTAQPAITILCDDQGAVPQSQADALKTYYESCFTDATALRQGNNALKFKLTGTQANGGTVRTNNVQTALNQIHNSSALTIPFHPGLDENGNPRKGPMSDVTISHVNGRKKKFVLPTGGANKPGDFVGAASASKCPVKIQFSMRGTYSINGNAGSGEQLLVLKDAYPGPCAATVCHELGHSMGMSAMSPAPAPPGLYTAPAAPLHVDDGGWYYRNHDTGPYVGGLRNLHAGPHCAHGMPEAKKADPTFNGWNPGATDNVCIMWGSGGTDDNRKQYCPTCTEILKARNLIDVRSTWASRADG